MPTFGRALTATVLTLAVVAALLVGALPARADMTIEVTTTDDTITCDTEGECSLRGAIQLANTTAGHDTILVPGGTYTLTLDGTGDDTGATGDLDVLEDVTIDGAGAAATVVDASGLATGDRVLHVHPGSALTLEGVTVTGGDAPADGGGILTESATVDDGTALVLRGVAVRDNAAVNGGGVYGGGESVDFDFAQTTVSGNLASDDLGGIGAQAPAVTVRLHEVQVGGDERITADMLASATFPDDANVAESEAGGAGFIGTASIDVAITDSAFDGNAAATNIGGFAAGLHDSSTSDPADNPIVLDGVSISGNGSGLSGGALTANATVTITESAINDNVATVAGGALGVSGSMTVTDSEISGNTADDMAGAAYMASDTTLTRARITENHAANEAAGLTFTYEDGGFLVLEDSTVADNTATYVAGVNVVDAFRLIAAQDAQDGSASLLDQLGGHDGNRRATGTTSSADAHADEGDVIISGTTFSGNVAQEEGDTPTTGFVGALYLRAIGAEIVNSTFSGNVAHEDGGAIYVDLGSPEQHVELTNVTFAGNGVVDDEGQGEDIYVAGGRIQASSQDAPAVTLTNTIVAGGPAANCAAPTSFILSDGSNIDDDGTCASEEGDLRVDPLLDDLADNGGPTATHALLEGSPAIDAADDVTCPATDQRGVDRPVDGDADGTAACDIGAYEVAGADLAVTASVDPDPVEASYDTAVEVTATNHGPVLAEDAVLSVELPDDTDIREIDAPAGVDCTVAGQDVTCDLGDVAAGADVTITVTVRPFTVGALETTASVSSTTADPDGSNNAVAVPFTVTGPAGAIRLSGTNRIETAVQTSVDMYDDDQAPAVVIARADDFADALTGTPLAIQLDAPLLLTWPAELHPSTEAEIDRVLPDGGRVILLGGTAALHPAVQARLDSLGYDVERYAGRDRFATAVDIADRALDNPDVLLLATGFDSADALAGGAAGGVTGGAVLLTAGPDLPATTAAYLASRGDATRYALGGPAARADTTATRLAGKTRFETAVAVAEAFFTSPRVAGVATAFDYPDALTGGAHIGRQGGPMLLTTGGDLHPSPKAYLGDQDSLEAVFLYGGTGVLSATVQTSAAATLQ